MSKYRALNGLNYPSKGGGEKRVEVGDVVDDIPPKAVSWLLRQGHIEEVKGGDE